MFVLKNCMKNEVWYQVLHQKAWINIMGNYKHNVWSKVDSDVELDVRENIYYNIWDKVESEIWRIAEINKDEK